MYVKQTGMPNRFRHWMFLSWVFFLACKELLFRLRRFPISFTRAHSHVFNHFSTAASSLYGLNRSLRLWGLLCVNNPYPASFFSSSSSLHLINNVSDALRSAILMNVYNVVVSHSTVTRTGAVWPPRRLGGRQIWKWWQHGMASKHCFITRNAAHPSFVWAWHAAITETTRRVMRTTHIVPYKRANS